MDELDAAVGDLMSSRSVNAGDFPNGRLTLQPDAKDIPGRVDVAIVRRSAVRAIPASHSKRTHAFRAAGGYTPTSRARLGTPSFISINIHGLPSGSLIPQHVAERRPARIQDGFSHLGFGKHGGVHIADNDQIILPSNPGRLFVKVVTARIGDLRIDRARPLLVSSPLSDSESVGMLPVMSERRNLVAIARGGQVPQAEVDADIPIAAEKIVLHLASHGKIPAATGVFYKRARFKHALCVPAHPETIGALHIGHGGPGDLHCSRNDGNPSKGAPRACGRSKLGTAAMLITRCRKGAANPVYRIGVDAKQVRASLRKPAKVNRGRPPAMFTGLPPAFRFALRRYAEVPDLIASHRVTPQMTTRRCVLDAELVGQKRHSVLLAWAERTNKKPVRVGDGK